MRKPNNLTCYMCDDKAISREHIPPAVFFPESKDLPSGFPDFRKNLMTVPSCDLHNLEKSKDDEYSFMIIVASYDNNAIANIYYKKAIRAIKYKPNLINFYLGKFVPVIVSGSESIAPIIDDSRLKKILEYIARGLFFYHYKKKWMIDLEVIPLSLFYNPSEPGYLQKNRMITTLKARINLLFDHILMLGENKKIFYYQFFENDNNHILRMKFYEGFEVIAIEKAVRWRENGTEN